MCAIYAFMRYCDDLSDGPEAGPATGPEARRAAIGRWRAEMEDALEGRFSQHPLWPAFHHTVRRFGIPHEYFHAMIDGVLSDLGPRRFQTFDELYRYCYQVASVVGLTVVHIFGFDTRSALPLAEKCGVAFQLTNILRDIREDAALGRVYLPAEDLRKFGVSEDDLRAGNRNEAFLRMMRFEAARARAYYDESQPLLDLIHPRSRPSLWALVTIYSSLLERIERSDYDVFRRRVRLSALEKSWIVVRALVT
jgi:phytoene synthase